MKKLLALTVACIFVIALLISCGSSKVCPAYASEDTEQSDTENS